MSQRILIAFFFGFGTAFGQNISADLISVSGKHDTNNLNQLTWIIGEALTKTISDNSAVLTHGILNTPLL